MSLAVESEDNLLGQPQPRIGNSQYMLALFLRIFILCYSCKVYAQIYHSTDDTMAIRDEQRLESQGTLSQSHRETCHTWYWDSELCSCKICAFGAVLTASSVTLPPHIRVLILPTLLSIRLPANVPEKATEDGHVFGIPTTYVGD